jgi:hypothetical protein
MSYKDRISSLERSNKNLSLELNEKGKLMEEILNDKDMERVDCMSLQEHSYAEVVKKDLSYKKQVGLKNSGVEGRIELESISTIVPTAPTVAPMGFNQDAIILQLEQMV